MTLAKFKHNLMVVGFLTLLIAYTGVVFYWGRVTKVEATQKELKKTTSLKSSIERPQAEDETLSSRVLSSYVKLCSNTSYGFEITYPKDWFTTYNNPEEQCTFFAPFSFVLPQVVDEEITPVLIKVIDPKDWDVTTKEYENPSEIYNISSIENISLNSRSVEKIQYLSTGVSKPTGFIKVSYLMFDSVKPLILTYQQFEEKEDIATNSQAVEEMAKSISFF